MPSAEVHVEQLLGKRVRDVDGRVVGRLEEFLVTIEDGEPAVTEFHIGPAAALERIGLFLTQLPYLRFIPIPEWQYRVSWRLMDLSDPNAPRLRVHRDAVARSRRPEPDD